MKKFIVVAALSAANAAFAGGFGAEGLGLLLAAVIHRNCAELVNGVGTDRARHHQVVIQVSHGAADVTA